MILGIFSNKISNLKKRTARTNEISKKSKLYVSICHFFILFFAKKQMIGLFFNHFFILMTPFFHQLVYQLFENIQREQNYI